jgi:cytoskeletal protein RodZ
VENKTLTTSKKVFVAMPENHIPKKQSQPIVVNTPPIVEEKPVVVEEKKVENKPLDTADYSLPKEPVLPKQEQIIKAYPVSLKEEPTLNEKYSESLDDIKKRYTETYLSRKKKSKWTSTHTSVLQVFGGAVFFCFLVVVAYRNFGGEEKPQSRTTIIQPDKRAINTGTATTTSTVIPPVVPEANISSVKKTQTKKEDRNIAAESLVTNSATQKKEEVIRENEEVIASEKKAVMPPKATEETKPKTKPININRLVNVKANNYKQRAFGGVMNLELTVNNDSKFELDKVIVELVYLKPSEQPIKTETIVFSSIEANGSKTLKIPDYLRGIKVSYRVMEIESSQYERYTTAGL